MVGWLSWWWLWKTTDAGETWQAVAEDPACTFCCMSGMVDDVIYMGTGEGFFNVNTVSGDGIFKSTDRGSTWSYLPSTADNESFRWVNRLAADPSNADIVLAATNSGIYRTVNGGTTWTEVYSYPTTSRWPGRLQNLRPQPGDFNRIIAGINGHDILISNDTGVTWRDTDAYSGEFERIELAYSESQPDTAYAAVDAGPSSAPTSVLLVSYDGGETWTVTNERGSSNTNWLGSQGWYNNTLAVHPFNPNTVFLGGIVLWRARITNTGNEYPAPIELDRGWYRFLDVSDEFWCIPLRWCSGLHA